MEFDPGFDIAFDETTSGYRYGVGVFGPKPELRRLDDIRPSLADPDSDGPDILYSIVMDVGLENDRAAMLDRNLLFGVVTYAAGKIGNEPVRSQGHVHAVSTSCGCSTCEVYEVWDGEAFIYMQERAADDAGRCIAVHAGPGDVVVVPPGWAHATVNADPRRRMTFGAWCVRDFGFEYDDVRAHGGLAYFPIVEKDGIYWSSNGSYRQSLLRVSPARTYPELGIEPGVPIYRQFQDSPDRFLFVSRPKLAQDVWRNA